MKMKEEIETGLVQIYTGNGKGKSTAAFGLALRAAGAGLKVVIIQYMKKGEWYGEIKALQQIPGVEIYSYGCDRFAKKGAPDEDNLAQVRAALAKTRKIYEQNQADLLILDELNNALFFELISEQEALALIQDKPQQMELVITGRNAPEALIKAADLVTEMCEIKHPYQNGVQARRGIEY